MYYLPRDTDVSYKRNTTGALWDSFLSASSKVEKPERQEDESRSFISNVGSYSPYMAGLAGVAGASYLAGYYRSNKARGVGPSYGAEYAEEGQQDANAVYQRGISRGIQMASETLRDDLYDYGIESGSREVFEAMSEFKRQKQWFQENQYALGKDERARDELRASFNDESSDSGQRRSASAESGANTGSRPGRGNRRRRNQSPVPGIRPLP